MAKIPPYTSRARPILPPVVRPGAPEALPYRAVARAGQVVSQTAVAGLELLKRRRSDNQVWTAQREAAELILAEERWQAENPGSYEEFEPRLVQLYRTIESKVAGKVTESMAKREFGRWMEDRKLALTHEVRLKTISVGKEIERAKLLLEIDLATKSGDLDRVRELSTGGIANGLLRADQAAKILATAPAVIAESQLQQVLLELEGIEDLEQRIAQAKQLRADVNKEEVLRDLPPSRKHELSLELTRKVKVYEAELEVAEREARKETEEEHDRFFIELTRTRTNWRVLDHELTERKDQMSRVSFDAWSTWVEKQRQVEEKAKREAAGDARKYGWLRNCQNLLVSVSDIDDAVEAGEISPDEGLKYHEELVKAQENDSVVYALLRDQIEQVESGDVSYYTSRNMIVQSQLSIEKKTTLWNKLETARDAFQEFRTSPYKPVYDQAFNVLRARREVMLPQEYWDERDLWINEFSGHLKDTKWDIAGFVTKRMEEVDKVIKERGGQIYEPATADQVAGTIDKYVKEEGRIPNYLEVEASLNKMGLTQQGLEVTPDETYSPLFWTF